MLHKHIFLSRLMQNFFIVGKGSGLLVILKQLPKANKNSPTLATLIIHKRVND
jgi:hypothetical protein